MNEEKLFFEKSFVKFRYTHTALLENGVTIQAFEDGTAVGDDGKHYRNVNHLDDDDEVVVDGWEPIE